MEGSMSYKAQMILQWNKRNSSNHIHKMANKYSEQLIHQNVCVQSYLNHFLLPKRVWLNSHPTKSLVCFTYRYFTCMYVYIYIYIYIHTHTHTHTHTYIYIRWIMSTLWGIDHYLPLNQYMSYYIFNFDMSEDSWITPRTKVSKFMYWIETSGHFMEINYLYFQYLCSSSVKYVA